MTAHAYLRAVMERLESLASSGGCRVRVATSDKHTSSERSHVHSGLVSCRFFPHRFLRLHFPCLEAGATQRPNNRSHCTGPYGLADSFLYQCHHLTKLLFLLIMPATTPLSNRFRELRERAGLSHDEAARRMGVPSPCIWDIENNDDDLTLGYSPRQVHHFCEVLGSSPRELFDVTTLEAAISATQLVEIIDAECRKRGVTLEQFEDFVGWRLSQSMKPPEQLLEDLSLDGLQWLCRELSIDWHRIILGL